MSLEQTIKDTLISESVDLDMRLQQLVRAGLMPASTIPLLRRGIAKVQGGYPLVGAERDVMANFLNAMMFIVLGDDAIFNKARMNVREDTHENCGTPDCCGECDTAVTEARGSDYTLYHKSYTDAINHALSHHEKSGLKVSDDDRFQHVAVGSKKPSEGNTTSLHIPATHSSGKKHMLHVQVFNKGGTHPYELNTYSSGMGRHVKEEAEQVDEVLDTPKAVKSYKTKAEKSFKDAMWKHDKKSVQTVQKRLYGLSHKKVDEEVEQIDELSKNTLKSYLDKTKTKPGEVVANVNDKDSMRKYTNRVVGGVRASRRVVAKESRRIEALADIAAITQMNESYKTTFNAALEQYGIKSPSELDEEKRKEFFNFVDQNYKKGDN